MSNKGTFASQLQVATNQFVQAAETLAEFEGIYFDRGYNSGGGNPITDPDVAAYGITASDVANMMTLIQQLGNFRGNAAVTTGAYDASINAMRTDK